MSEESRKVALVTGASRGIGAAIASVLADAGSIVVGTATSEQGAGKINEALSSRDGHGRVLNVTDPTSVDALLANIRADIGDPLVLVNNAGITQDNIIMRMKDDEWQSVIDTNLTALYRLSKACVRGMTKARWGRIINITSVVGSMGNAGQSNYAATKAGAEGMARSLARELGSRAITVNCVAPGFIDTDMTRALETAQRDVLQTQIPLGRLGEPEDVAAAVAFLASDAGQYITGETIHVNGGLYMG
ncbi:MAG: 3-oxoacyl-ACP reductase FabG [Luminiphilus sp.]|nr:3-oxoacyl-ACP reductase FabG [Luminiphilus sp.]